MRYVVAQVGDIPPGSRKIVDVGRRSIGIFNLDGEFFALRNSCPHQGGPLCEGTVWGSVTASLPGEFEYGPSRDMLTCPWHGWEFHIRTGQSWCQPERLRTGEYPVGVLSGRQLLASGGEDGGGPAGRVRGPYRADTVTVTVEGEYVVVDVH